MQRREFLRTATAAASTAAMGPIPARGAKDKPTMPLWKKLPRWRGFNLLEKFMQHSNKKFLETDFQWLRDWGFDFVRIPMDYRCWTDPKDPYKLREKVLAEIDECVALGRKHGVHVSLNLHRAPGYTVASPAEKLNLWTSDQAQKQFDFQWATFAGRYKEIPSEQLSFDLVNEPAKIASKVYAKVAKRVVAAIRKVDPDRLIISDGLQWGREPVWELAGDRIAQSTRGYDPFELTHYKASWVGKRTWGAPPTWPVKKGKNVQGRAWLLRDRIQPWKKLADAGVGVHVGEWGAFRHTPHHVVLAWMKDQLELWAEAGFGWALWNFRGAFGVLDSQRQDVKYEDFHGHKLDRKMLDLLRAH